MVPPIPEKLLTAKISQYTAVAMPMTMKLREFSVTPVYGLKSQLRIAQGPQQHQQKRKQQLGCCAVSQPKGPTVILFFFGGE